MELPNLEGKLIGVVLAHSPVNQMGMVVLERARLETVSDRAFITGFIPSDEPDSWVRGLPAGVAWEFVGYHLIFNSYHEQHVSVAWSAVVSYYIFESREDYMNRVAIFRRVRAQARR